MTDSHPTMNSYNLPNNFIFGIYIEDEMLNLLRLADADPLLTGFVYTDDKSKIRLPIFCENNQLVGFATPRQESDGVWRMGAIYIIPEFRNRGIAGKTIFSFMTGKKGRAFIEDENISSQKAYQKAGFRSIRVDLKNAGSWWEN